MRLSSRQVVLKRMGARMNSRRPQPPWRYELQGVSAETDFEIGVDDGANA